MSRSRSGGDKTLDGAVLGSSSQLADHKSSCFFPLGSLKLVLGKLGLEPVDCCSVRKFTIGGSSNDKYLVVC